MKDRIEKVLEEVLNFPVKNKQELEQFKLKFLTKKSELNELFSFLKDVNPEDRKTIGAHLNKLKNAAQEKFSIKMVELEEVGAKGAGEMPDLSLPVIPNTLGARHPLTIVRERIIEIFTRMGFNISEGPEIEDDWHNFSALNFPENHPAREMQDTFFINKNPDIALRTHTSSVQIRVMEEQKPPIRTLAPGRVFRNEAISARAHCVFHQIEGFFIDEKVSFVDLKQTLYHFAKELFGKDTQIRFRPSFFPFTEPSAEIDVSCLLCKGAGCTVCKHTGWVEIGGSGMIDPNVLKNCNIDPQKYSGFAFGMGIERITMLKYQIKDLRLFTENDVRFLKQFKHL